MENLIIQNMNIAYQGQSAIRNATLAFEPNKLTGIVGPNGAGKSTLLKGIMGLTPLNTGAVSLYGKPLKEMMNKVAYVEQRQEIDLSFPIDVFGTVLFGTYAKLGFFQRPKQKEKDLASKALEKVGMSAFKDRHISELSGGQLQRVFIARALAQEAEWLLLDEPFAGIDATSEKIIIELLKQLRDEGKSIVIVHHDLHKVQSYFDDIVLINKEVVAFGTVSEVFTANNMRRAYGEAISEMISLGGGTNVK